MGSPKVYDRFQDLVDVTFTATDGYVPVYRTASGKMVLEALSTGPSLPLSATDGGTGTGTYTAGDMLYASGTNTLSKLAGNGTATTKVLRMISGVPSWIDFTAGNLNDAVTLPILSADNIFTGQNTFAAGTITASKPLTITQTWNNAAVAFDALSISVTNSNSTSASTLFRASVGGTDQVTISRSGALACAAISRTTGSTTLDIQSLNSSTAGLQQTRFANGTFTQSSGTFTAVAITPTYNQSGTAGSTDLKIARTETSLGSGSHRLIDCYAGAAGTTNLFAVSNQGSVGAVRYYVDPSGTPFSGPYFEYVSIQQLRAMANNGSDACAISANVFRTTSQFTGTGSNSSIGIMNQNWSSVSTAVTMCNGTSTHSSGSFTAVAITPTINQTGTATGYTALKIAVTETAVLGTNRLIDCYAGAAGTTNVFWLNNSGHMQVGSGGPRLKNSSEVLQVRSNNDSFYGIVEIYGLRIDNGQYGTFTSTLIELPTGSSIKWSSTANATAAKDTGLSRSAAGVVKATNGSTGYGDLSCQFLRTEGLNAGGTVSAGPDGVLQVKDNAGNTRYIPYYNSATLA